MHMKRYLYLILLCSSLLASAQNTQILISQAVRNSFTRVGVTDARVTVMDKRGQIIDTLRTDPKMGIWTLNVPRKPTTFRIRVEHPQYETGEMMVNMNHPARIYNFKMPDMLLKIKADKQLGEAVVRATRVKLYYRGDTIVVNASAFKLPEGSMLEGLVRSVPGCEMRENGDIYMNGKKVDYLMLNGKDFFKGNNRIMLDNLPYYTVDKLEFYYQDSELSQLTGRSHGEQDYVMNVKMKKEYSIGYLGNLEGAGGTRERWLGRAFSVRFTDNSRLTLFANVNNVNENRSPGRDGDWSSANAPTGETRLYNVGGELMIDDKYGRYRETANAVFNYRRSLNETHTATESFLPSGSVFSRAQQADRRHGFDLNATNHLTLKRIGLISDTRFSYRKEDTRTESRTGQFSQSPAAYGSTVAVLDSLFSATPGQLMRMAVNRTRTTAEGYDRQLTVSQKFDFRKELPWGDDLILGASAEWTDGSGRLTDHYLQDLLGSNPATEQQDRLQRQFRRGYDVMAKAGYTIHLLNGWHFTLEDAFHQRLQKTGSHLYRLDWDEHFAGGEVLPSAADYARLQDRANSWNSDNLYRANETRLQAAYNKQDNERGRNTSFSLNLPIFYTWTTRALPARRPAHRRHGLPLDIPPQPEPGIQHPALARPLPAELLHGHARPRPDPESGLHGYLQPAADSAGQPQPEAEHEPPRKPAGTLTAERQCAPPDLEQPVQHPARPDGAERQLRTADGRVHLSARQPQRQLEHAAQPALPPQAGPQEPLQHGCQHPVRLLPQRGPENRRHGGQAAPQPRGPVPAHGGPGPAL